MMNEAVNSSNNNDSSHYRRRRPGEYKRKRQHLASSAVVHEFVSLLYKRIASPLQQQQQLQGARRDSMTLQHQQERLHELLCPRKPQIPRDTSCSSASSSSSCSSALPTDAEAQMTYPSLSMIPSREAIQWYYNSFSHLHKGQETGAPVDRAKHFAQACLARPLATRTLEDIYCGQFLDVMVHNVAASLVRLVRADFAAAHQQQQPHGTAAGSNKRSLDASGASCANLPHFINVESAYVSLVPLPGEEQEEEKQTWESEAESEHNHKDNTEAEDERDDEGMTELVTVPVDCSMALQVSLLYQHRKRKTTVMVPVSLETTGFVTAQVPSINGSPWISNVELALDTEKVFVSLRQQARAVVAQSSAMSVIHEAEEEEEDEDDEEENGDETENDDDDDDDENEEDRRMPLSTCLTKKQKTGNTQL